MGTDALLLCVECGQHVRELYKEYSERNIRLERCEYCRNVADKYVEYEPVLLVIDLALLREHAYRHLLFNRQRKAKESDEYGHWPKFSLAQATLLLLVLEACLVHLMSVNIPSLEVCEDHSGAATYNVAYSTPDWEFSPSSVAYTIRLVQVCAMEYAMFLFGVYIVVLWYQTRHIAGSGASAAPCTSSASTQSATGTTTRCDGAGPQQLEGGHESPNISRYKEVKQTVVNVLRRVKAMISKSREEGQRQRRLRIYMALLYPIFFKLLALFVLIWDQQAVIMKIVSLYVLRIQHLALSVVLPVVLGEQQGHGGSQADRGYGVHDSRGMISYFDHCYTQLAFTVLAGGVVAKAALAGICAHSAS